MLRNKFSFKQKYIYRKKRQPLRKQNKVVKEGDLIIFKIYLIVIIFIYIYIYLFINNR
jgi:Trk-type K+ transport system membrane component